MTGIATLGVAGWGRRHKEIALASRGKGKGKNEKNPPGRQEKIRTGETAAGADQSGAPEQPVPLDHGLRALPPSSLILDSVGPTLLSAIVDGLPDLSGASCAVVEKNGAYALTAGTWHLCESSAREASLRSLEAGEPVDLAGPGGSRVFAAPIRAGEEIIGSICLGYGGPPRDPAQLQEPGKAHQVPFARLQEEGAAYEARPASISAHAKKRLLSAARLIGAIVLRHREEEARFQRLFERAADALFLHDLEGRFVEVNQAACESLDYTRAELLKLPFSAIVKVKEPKALKELWAKVGKGEKLITRGQHLRRDGTAFPVEVKLGPFEYEGRPHILASARDITGRLRAEEALRTSESFLNSIIDQSPYPMWIADAQGTLIKLNQACQDLLHLTAAEVVGKYNVFQDNIVLDQGLFPLLQRVFHQGETVRFELAYDTSLLKSLPLKNPAQVILDVTVSPIKDGSGKITNAVFQHVDVTGRRQAEEALRASEARFRQVVESSPLPLGFCFADGRVEYLNPKFVETFGYTLEDIPRVADWFRLAYPDPAYRQTLINRWQEALARFARDKSSSETVEVEITCKDGSRRIMQIFGSPMGDKLLVVFNDLTERKRMEQALEKRLVSLSKPLDDPGEIDFHDLFNLRDIQQIQDQFAKITGVASVITNPDGIPITTPSNFSRLCRDIIRKTEKGRLGCQISHAIVSQYKPDGPIIHQCPSAGLHSAGASITIGGKHIANWMIGQIREKTPDEGDIRNKARNLGANEEEFLAAFREAPVMSKHRFRQVAQALFVFANQLSTLAYQNVQQARFITERQRLEEELREKEKKYRTLYQEFRGILEAIPDGVSLISPDLKIVWINDTPERTFLGKRPSEGIGKFCYQARHGRPTPCEKCPVQECFTSGKPTLGESATPEGRIFEIHALPLCGDQGEVNAVIEVARDVTARKREEEERAKLEAQMREVQKLESLGVLAGGIAHDFNNLLMAILGNADLAMLSLPLASPARPNVEGIILATQRASDLCRQMLAYSGKGHFVVGRHDLSEIVREMAHILEVSVSKKASLRYSFEADLPPVEVDATQMRQVIMNLITNASEALGEKSGVISVATGIMDCDRNYLASSFLDEKLHEGRYAYLEVADTGCGMDQETQRRIFDPFYTTKFTGRGLGLAAVLGIVRGHRGAIKVYSEPGRGTAIKVLLPVGEWTPADLAPSGMQRPLPLPGGTILLVDDDPEVRVVGSQMLERLGFQVIVAASGREALDAYRAQAGEIDCVLLDLTMPEMDGEEVFRKLRRLRREALVIISSGYNEQEVTQRFPGKKLAGFIQKPYSLDKLREVLTRVLG